MIIEIWRLFGTWNLEIGYSSERRTVGKKRIKLISTEPEEEKSAVAKAVADKGKKPIFKEKKLKKAGKGEGRLSNMGLKALEEMEKIAAKAKEAEKLTDKKKEPLKELKDIEDTKKEKKPKRIRSRRYRLNKIKVDRNQLYPLKEAVKLLLSVANSKIDETVEVHISTHESKLTGAVKLPHGTGKSQKIAIVDDKLLAQVAKGKIDFDVLLASPDMMPKIAKFARILGPKGLIPNPKAGTISENPEELKKKIETGHELRFKTEPKAPLLHLTIGKISFGEEKILENLKATIEAVKVKNIKKAVLTSTHSPGIKLQLD